MISIGDPFESAGGSTPRKSAMVGMTSRSVTTPALRVESDVSDPSSRSSGEQVARTSPGARRVDAARPWRRSSPARAWSRRRRPARIRRRPTSPSRRSSLATPSSPPSRVGSSHRRWTFCSPGAMPASPSVGNPFCSVISAAPPLVARAATSGIPSISSNETPGTRKTKTSPVSPLTCARAEVEAKPPATMSRQQERAETRAGHDRAGERSRSRRTTAPSAASLASISW